VDINYISKSYSIKDDSESLGDDLGENIVEKDGKTFTIKTSIRYLAKQQEQIQ